MCIVVKNIFIAVVEIILSYIAILFNKTKQNKKNKK